MASLAAAGASDWLDGYLAKRWGQQSVLGSYLDPLADKVLICTTVGALAVEVRRAVFGLGLFWCLTIAWPSRWGGQATVRPSRWQAPESTHICKLAVFADFLQASTEMKMV